MKRGDFKRNSETLRNAAIGGKNQRGIGKTLEGMDKRSKKALHTYSKRGAADMLLKGKKTTGYYKWGLALAILMLLISGCGDVEKEEIKVIETVNKTADESKVTVEKENKEEGEEEKKW